MSDTEMEVSKKTFEDTSMKFNIWLKPSNSGMCPICLSRVIVYGVSWGFKQYGLPVHINTMGKKEMCENCINKYDLIHPDNEKRKKGLALMKMKGHV